MYISNGFLKFELYEYILRYLFSNIDILVYHKNNNTSIVIININNINITIKLKIHIRITQIDHYRDVTDKFYRLSVNLYVNCKCFYSYIEVSI